MRSSLTDLAELGKLFADHQDRLLAMLRQRIDPALTPRIDPEDLLTETFLRARDRWPGYKLHPTASAYVWLYGLARDCLIEAWRRENRGRRDLGREVPYPERSSLQMGLGLVNPGTSPSEAFARAELRERICRALQQLPPADREVLWLRSFDGLGFKEVAEVLSQNEGKEVAANAATVRYVRALKRLKDLWQEMEGPA